MSEFFDSLETRSDDERAADIAEKLPQLISHACASTPYYQNSLKDVVAADITSKGALASLPILRKSDLIAVQGKPAAFHNFIALPASKIEHIFQSPGPIFEIGMRSADWWRFGRAVKAVGIGAGDIVQNCFSYHFTPAGVMFESAAQAVGATVVPAGTGQTELQAQSIAQLGVTAYAGTPDYLLSILEKADEMGLDSSSVKYACVSAGPLFPQLREAYAARNIHCRQCYGTADVGMIAYESELTDGMITDEGVIVEIVTPGTGTPVAEGEIGEVVVTSFNRDMPMIRFATGDLSAYMAGQSPCGRTNQLIVGWRGRADQAAKVKGMFVRPEQAAQFVGRFDTVSKLRLTITHDGSKDILSAQIEASAGNEAEFMQAVQDIFKLRASVEIVPIGSLPKDGIVIDDKRDIG